MRARFLTLLGLLALILCAIIWWWLHPSPPLPTTAEPMFTKEGALIHVRPTTELAKRLKIEPVQTQILPHMVEVPAQLITPASGTFPIYSPVTGRISAIYVDEGQKVKKGDLLASVVSGDMAQAYADNEKAQAALKFAQEAYHRANAVLQIGGNAVKDRESTYNDLLQAQSEAKRAKTKLLSFSEQNAIQGDQKPHETIDIRAPRDGLVSSINVAVGQNLVDTSTILINIFNIDKLILQASVPENLLHFITPNVNVTAEINGEKCTGTVSAIDPNLHNETRYLNLYLPCNNQKGKLYSGQYVTASLDIAQDEQLLLPKTALLMNNDAISVFVETTPNTYTRKMITVSYDEGDNVRVLSGLSPDEHVVTHGAILLNDY